MKKALVHCVQSVNILLVCDHLRQDTLGSMSITVREALHEEIGQVH